MRGRRGLFVVLASFLGATTLACVAATAGSAETEPGLASALARGQYLEAELTIARGKGFYVVFDLEGGAIELKARAVAFRSWPVNAFQLWGQVPGAGALVLEEREALFGPERASVAAPDPAVTGTAPKVAPAVEVTDMPTRYDLRLSQGVRVAVVPKVTGLLPRLGAAFPWLWQRVTVPLAALWSRVRGRPFATLEVALEPADARALYWAFTEGMRALVWLPPPRATISAQGS